MHIEIDTSTASQRDLTALAALIASLRGEPLAVHVASPGFSGLTAPRDEPLASDGFPVPESVTVRPIEPAPSSNGPTSEPIDHTGSDTETEASSSPPAADSSGLPWDERIHAASKATNADGTWRARRNTPADLVERVTAELRANSRSTVGNGLGPTDMSGAGTTNLTNSGIMIETALAANNAPPPPPVGNVAPPPPPPAPPVDASTAPSSAPDVGSPSAAAPAPVSAAPPPPPASDEPMTKPAFIKAVSESSNPAPTYDALNALAKTMFGVADFKTIVTEHPEMWADFLAAVKG